MLPLVFWSLVLGWHNARLTIFSNVKRAAVISTCAILAWCSIPRRPFATSGERSSAEVYALSTGRAEAAYAATFSEIQVLSPHWQSNM
jgi:hypothetical protein